MLNEDSLEVRQENEIQALKAIFNEDLRDLRSAKPWKIWKPLDIVVTLSPLQGSSGLQEIHAQVDMHIKCSENYPNEEPQILLEQSRGMSDALLKELKQQLEQKATELKGEVMVYELAQHVQAFLHDHNKPGYKSFYEEMLSRQRQQEQLQQQAKQLEEDRKRQVMQSEIHRRQEILRSEIKHRRDYNSTSSELNPDVSSSNLKKNSRKSNSSTSDYSEENVCEHTGTELIIFDSNSERNVQKGRCLAHSDRGCIVYSGLDLNTGEILAITEWKVFTKDQFDVNYCLKQINSCEQEFTYLSKLRHFNIVRYLNMKYVQEKEQFTIYVLQEFVCGANCNALFIKENVPADIDMLRYIACGVLNALDFLHRNNVVHKELRDSCIFIDNNGVVKVSGYSLEVKLGDLSSQTQNTEYYSKKTDIYKFGLFMLSMLKGSVIDNVGVEISPTLPPDLFDFLSKCLTKDEKTRLNTSQLLQHQFVRTPLQRMSPKRNYKDNSLPGVISPSQQSSTDIKFYCQNRSGGPSRIQNEFEVLKWLGRGAFGDVLKVRNKLDGGYYAIKRIELNPKNKQLNRKITREVKLLSRLNHENVVRYYNSWIESAVLGEKEYSSDELSTDASSQPRNKKNLELSFGNDIELLAPPMKDVEWSVSYESKSKSKHNTEISSSSSEDDSSDDEDWIGFLPNHTADSSDSIEFERSGNAAESDTISESAGNKSLNEGSASRNSSREIQFMYIQMEFCEKSTLRTAIDAGLYNDMDRVWRLFREIVEGLAHIHQQGMIHRDLKPVNIFLDLNDHVKIGDFGLATTNIIRLPTDVISKNILESEREISLDTDGSMTGHIGTALYVAPELSATAKAIYNQKVDIYSLGIILFEMCYSGLNTGMERIKVLSNIRLTEILYPKDFLDVQFTKHRTVISWLLNHDVSQRPTSQELLQSEHIPPPILEECELRELVRHTLTNPQSKAYKYLVASCFGQELNYVEDITYDMSLPATITRPLQLQEYVKQAVIKVFKLHGGQCLSTPLLMPKSNYYDGIDTCVKLMTHSGSIISIPHDLRVPFARYVAWNSITLLKRYSVERVYREKKIFGFHPRELYECAFDIVTPTSGTFMADAEVLSIVSDIVNQFADLKNKNFVIRLNHASLLKAILLHCGIPGEKHNDIYSILSNARDGKVSKFQIRTHLISLCLTDNAMVALFSLIESEAPINKVANTLRMITKRKGEASQLAKQGLNELTKIIENTESLGVKYNIVVALGLVYNVQQYSGMMCQFVCELKKKRRRGGLDVLAAGGRYDCMLSNYRLIMERSGMATRDVTQSAVGISISLDKFVQALQEEQSAEVQGLCNLDVIVCSQGTRPMSKEKAKIMRDLWTNGIRCSLLETQTLEEIQELCTELHVSHIVILNDTEQGVVRVRSWERDRFQERKVNINELSDFMQKLIKLWNEGSNECASSSSYVGSIPSRSDSRVSISEHSTANYTTTVIVNFITSPTGKLAANTRKRLENQVLSQMESTLQRFSTREQVVVLGLNLESSVIKTLASYLELDSDESLQKSMNLVIERHPRHKKYLVQICDEILDYCTDKSRPILALYSLPDSMFKLLL